MTFLEQSFINILICVYSPVFSSPSPLQTDFVLSDKDFLGEKWETIEKSMSGRRGNVWGRFLKEDGSALPPETLGGRECLQFPGEAGTRHSGPLPPRIPVPQAWHGSHRAADLRELGRQGQWMHWR